MPYTIDDITPTERERLGDAEAQALVAHWNASEVEQATRAANPVKTLADRVAELEAEVAALKTR